MGGWTREGEQPHTHLRQELTPLALGVTVKTLIARRSSPLCRSRPTLRGICCPSAGRSVAVGESVKLKGAQHHRLESRW